MLSFQDYSFTINKQSTYKKSQRLFIKGKFNHIWPFWLGDQISSNVDSLIYFSINSKEKDTEMVEIDKKSTFLKSLINLKFNWFWLNNIFYN